jgi:hypothetical protein
MPTYDPGTEPSHGPVGSVRGGMEGDRPGENMDDTSKRHNQDGRTSPAVMYNPYYTGRPRSSHDATKYTAVDRQEIIRKLKSRDKSSRPGSPELERPSSALGRIRESPTLVQSPGRSVDQRPLSSDGRNESQAIGMQIERPRSALHRGDFRQADQRSPSTLSRFASSETYAQPSPLSTSPVAPWHSQFLTAASRQAWIDERPSSPLWHSMPVPSSIRPRAISSSVLSNSFTYQPPTSPLVHQSRPDTPELSDGHRSRSPERSRRHTFSPRALQSFPALNYPSAARSNASQAVPALRREGTYPYQAHQPRRSLHSFNSLPHTPAAGSRRPSMSDSPLHHAPMVGSYEESILRGRMSTTPSKPLNFVAQLGVLGKGKCSAKLRCPPHAIVPFPAVFYSYGNKNGTADDQPSPYVGLVDLENSLPAPEQSPDKRRKRLEQKLHTVLSDTGSRATSQSREDGSASEAQNKRRKVQKHKRRSTSPKAPPGGSYRIPQQGQLQIVLKSPNKTAVKLFLLPYDLSDMEPGQKTFIRQRSYSAGPIIDMPLNSRPNLGTDRPEAALSTSDDPNDRPMLRYLIHLHICCPSKGRFFLYKSIRVVFANRVPDGKEKLRNEIQLPEPRYSTYKPGRDPIAAPAATTASHRRRSSAMDALGAASETRWPHAPHAPHHSGHSLPWSDYHPSDHNTPMHSFQFPSALPTLESRPASRQTEIMDVDSQVSQEMRETLSPMSSSGMLSPARSRVERGSCDEEDPFVFERDRSRERRPVDGGKGDSVLSQRLRGLALHGP